MACRGRVGAGSRGCEPHGCGDQAPMDGFTASPANPHRPAKPANRCMPAFGLNPAADTHGVSLRDLSTASIPNMTRIAAHGKLPA